MANSYEERRRLAERYAKMTDGELQKLASDATSLTDEAWDVLKEELDRRNLLDEVEDHSSSPTELQFQKLMTIREFRDLPEALLAQGCLQSAGIQCFLADDNLVRVDWFYSNAIGGIKLRVKPEDARTAVEILNQPIPGEFNVQDVGIYEQPKCPKCGSLDVAFEELNKPIAFTSAYILNFPIPIHNKGWKCHSCKHEWQEEDSGNSEDQQPIAQ